LGHAQVVEHLLWTEGVAQAVEHLLCKHEALSSNSSLIKEKEEP
jgi:hypothetical protein